MRPEGATGFLLNLLNLDAIAHHPDFQLTEALFPALLVGSHPPTVFVGVRNIDHKKPEVVTEQLLVVLPKPFRPLFVVRYGMKLLNDFINRLA
jgi:hypothetical protein